MEDLHSSVVIRLKGGLGNQLFQYAAARALSIETDRTLIIDKGWYARKNRPRKYRLNEFRIHQKTVEYSKSALSVLKLKSPLAKRQLVSGPTLIREPHNLSYQPFNADLPNHIFLEGYWQSYKYFEKYRQTILDDFQLAPAIETSSLSPPESNTVAVHIRRGDYITSTSAHVVTEKYVNNAMAQFDSNTHFLFFSDDLDWCRSTFSADNLSFSNQPSDLMDLMQMSMCAHNIIANSSFSWWSAWLNNNPNQRVIAPMPWSEGGITHPDILPDHWETLPIE